MRARSAQSDVRVAGMLNFRPPLVAWAILWHPMRTITRRTVVGILPALRLAAADAIGKQRAVWPPKQGVKTPGVQIPMTSLKAEAEVAVAGLSGAVTLTQEVLAPQRATGALLRIDGKTNKPGEAIGGLNQPCGGVVPAFGSLWVPSGGKKTLERLDPKTGKATASIPAETGSASVAIAASDDSIWLLADDRTTLARIDPQGNAIVSELRLPAMCNSILSAEGALWVSCPAENRALRIDPKTNLVVIRIEVAGGPVSIASGAASIWVLSKAEGKVARIDPKTNKVTTTIELGIPNAAGTIEFGEGSVWVGAPGFPISRIDPQTDKVAQQFAGAGAGPLKFGLGSLWLSNIDQGKVMRYDPKRITATLAE